MCADRLREHILQSEDHFRFSQTLLNFTLNFFTFSEEKLFLIKKKVMSGVTKFRYVFDNTIKIFLLLKN